MLRQAFNSFLDCVILENCKKESDYWSLFASELPTEDKNLFLTYLTTVDDFEDLTSNALREREAYKEYEPEMQYLINQRIDDLYYQIKREQSGR